MTLYRRAVSGLAFALVGVVSFVAGCGGATGPELHPVTGKVLVNGKPAEHAIVVFHPVGQAGQDVVKPRGKVGADGSFTLTTFVGNDGAPAGEYRVSVELWLAGRPDEGPSSRLPAKFANPETSGLTARVAAGTNELKAFELKR